MSTSSITSLLESLPELLRSEARAALETYVEAGGNIPEDSAPANKLIRLFACSSFAARVARRFPDAIGGLLSSNILEKPFSQLELDQRLSKLIKGDGDEQLMTTLRKARQLECFRIAWRDISEHCSLEETMSAISCLADRCIQIALEHVTRSHRESYGSVAGVVNEPQELLVVGLGKLGANELNFSSDVDLLFAYRETGESNGERTLHSDEYFTRLAQRLIRILDQNTSDGFVYRVDMRLRPFGDSGPLVMSFNALENYYQQHGREWERYALIKARPITGTRNDGADLLTMLRPFVYRRYLDYGIFESLREMKTGIAGEVARKGLRDNIKIGPGGIREIEFLGQSFQLIRGGRLPALQQREILKVLKVLAQGEYIEREIADELADAYQYLRQVENRLQEFDDGQVHELPTDEINRCRLAYAMGCQEWPAFLERLNHYRDFVTACFDSQLQLPELPGAKETNDARFTELWREGGARDSAQSLLNYAGYKNSERALQLIESTRAGILRRHPGEQGRRLLDKAIPALINVISTTAQPETTLERVLRIIDAIALRTTYIALLVENQGVLTRLVDVVAISPFIADMLARYPLLLDELIDPRVLEHVPVLSELEAEFAHYMQDQNRDEVEQRMEVLSEFQQVNVMRIALADVLGKLPLMKVSDHLTRVAEYVVQDVTQTGQYQLELKHGRAVGTQFCIVAYGKFGGLELGYGSDLDLVFIHNVNDDIETEGDQPIAASLFYLRLVQRIINWLSTSTHSGALYSVDTRLRPSGNAGLLVTGIESFARYQEEQAWSWEHQALYRARAIAGDPELMQQFESLRRDILSQARDTEVLRRRVCEMREKMLLDRLGSASGFDPKMDSGGIVDVEFLVQFLVLAHASNHPDLLSYPDTIRGLEGLEQIGILSAIESKTLSVAYRELRAVTHRAALQGLPAIQDETKLSKLRETVSDYWQRFVAEGQPPGTP